MPPSVKDLWPNHGSLASFSFSINGRKPAYGTRASPHRVWSKI